MTLPRRTRRRIDALIALGIAIAVAVVAVGLWLGSDVRATTLHTAEGSTAPTTPLPESTLPTSLTPAWTLRTDPRYRAVASVYGTVVTADRHTVTGHDAATGDAVWSYARSNRTLCAIGSGDTTTDDLDNWSGVHGIMTVFAKNGYCSQVTLLNPTTGERLYQRTSPNQDPGELFFGAPYVGWKGSDYLELWRHDLVATIRYGDQPNPVNANGPHTGCTFSDAAVVRMALATVEHCGDGNATVVLNWPTPSDAPDNDDNDWDANHSTPKATIDTGSRDAVIVGLTDERVAVAVSQPAPAVVVYDSSGSEISRSPVPLTAEEIADTAASGITPSVTYHNRRYSLVGRHLLAMAAESVTVTVPPTTPAPPSDGGDVDAESGPESSEAPDTGPTTTTEQSPVVRWIADDALGLPAQVGENILVPVPDGLQARAASDGSPGPTIPVDRPDDAGRVDVTAIGPTVVEVRDDEVVGLTTP